MKTSTLIKLIVTIAILNGLVAFAMTLIAMNLLF
jgi:hypothetical protein